MSRHPVPLLAAALFLLASCGSQSADRSYTNPEWRASLKRTVTFPLAQATTLTVGLSSGMAQPSSGNLSLEWLEKRTSIHLELVGLPNSPGDVELGELLRAGKLPDIIPEDRFDLGEEWSRRLFVNVLEFRSLIPSFLARVRADGELLRGSLARSTEQGELYSLGSYRRDDLPYAGVLAYRRDLFQKLGLAAGSWEEITASLGALKRAFPDSVPFAGFFGTLLALMPSWFGSGYDPDNLVYYDPTRGGWRFGPDEEGFRRFVTFLAELYRLHLLNPDLFVGQEDQTPRYFSSGSAFMAPWRGGTGPLFPYYSEGYGKLTDEGEWDGDGAWVESLPLPPVEGRSVRAGASLESRVGSGWLVYNQSPRAAEALALLDLMYDPEVSVVMALGPEGTAWESKEGKTALMGSLAESYRSGGGSAVQQALKERGVGLDLGGESWSYINGLGFPGGAAYRYYAAHDLAANRPGERIVMQPGIRVPRESSFREARAGLVVALQTTIESGVANFIIGRKPLAGYDAFRAELAKMGSGKLLELYRSRATLVDGAAILGSP